MKIHMVKQGDTLYFIGQKYNVSLEEILALNPGITNPDVLEVGMKLKIPSTNASNQGVSGMDIMHQHIVKQGDTLWKLSKAWGVPLATMVHANPHLKNPNVLLTGEIVNIPKADAKVPATMHQKSMYGKTSTHPLHPSSLMQGVQGIVGKTLTGFTTDKKNTAPMLDKKPTGPIVSPVPPAPAPKPPAAKVEPAKKAEPQKKVEPLASKVEPLTSKVEPLVSKVEPLASKVEPLASKVEPLASKVEPLASKTQPLSTGKVVPQSSNVAPLSSNVAPLSSGNVGPLSSNVGPLSPQSSNVGPLSSNVASLSTGNVGPLSSNVAPLSTGNVAPLSSNVGPNANIAPLANTAPATKVAPYAKKVLPIEKPVETKLNPIHSEYMQSVDLFQQYGTPAPDLMSLYDMPNFTHGNGANMAQPYFDTPNNVMPYSVNPPANIGPMSESAHMYPYDCPPGSIMMGYPTPALLPYGAGTGWGHGNNMHYQAMGENMPNAGMMSPMSNMPNAGMKSPMSNMPNAGMMSPLSNSQLAELSSMYPPPGYAGFNAGYPTGYPYPMWPNSNSAPVATATKGSDDCGCGGKREDEIIDSFANAGTSKTLASKPRKKGKKAVIRTIAPRPKKKTTSGSRPWLNR